MLAKTKALLKGAILSFLSTIFVFITFLFYFLVIDKAVAYLERDELPPHWDKEILFNMGEESTTESSESEEIDDEDDAESPEEKDHLVKQHV